jgi:hypothetical protein
MLFTRGSEMVALAMAILACSGAESPYAETRTTLEKWVETRQLISKTRADWQGAKETLQQSVALFERELQGVQEQSSKLSTNNTQIDKERREAEAAKQSAEESLVRAREFATAFESQIRTLLPQLPSPLQETLQPLVLRMPADANTKMTAAERLQVLVGILNEVDKFNSSVSVFNEKRRNSRGEEMAVETVYVGLGSAYFANETGEFAGRGSPGPKGWEWQIQNGLGPSIRETIKIYRNEQPAHFVSLPATIR